MYASLSASTLTMYTLVTSTLVTSTLLEGRCPHRPYIDDVDVVTPVRIPG